MTYNNEKFAVNGREWKAIATELQERRDGSGDLAWDSLRNMKASYNAGDDVVDVAWDAYTMFKGDNLLYGASLYQSLPSMADEVINMALDLLNAPTGAGGTITTGGTESILLGVRAAYRQACQNRTFSGIPEIVVPFSAHAAFEKAASLMGLSVVRAPLKEYRADIEAMAEAINENTFMIVGSAPAYPMGHVDAIKDIAVLAQKHDLWLHVDCCVGGFFLPFAAALGNPVPDFDFSIPEVCSISVDLHKYGYTARGASLLLLQDETLSRFHNFDFNAWPTGEFNTPTLTGSRPAGAVASAWAVMNYLGYDGYLDRVEKTLQSKKQIIAAVEAVPGIRKVGNPEGGIVAFCCDDGSLDMFAVRDGITERGWQTGVIMDPPGFQVLLNYRHGEVAKELGRDLGEVAELVRQGKITTKGGDLSYGG